MSVAEQLEALVAQEADEVWIEIKETRHLAVLLTGGSNALYHRKEIRMIKLS